MSVSPTVFDAIARLYPAVPGSTRPVDSRVLARDLEKALGITVPQSLRDLWSSLGAGSFDRGHIYLYGDEDTGLPGPNLVDWNRAAWRRGIFPATELGGPFFFGATAFGSQLGLRLEGGEAVPIVFVPLEVESYRLAERFDGLLTEVLTDPSGIEDSDRLNEARAQLGQAPAGSCYVCDLSPLLTGIDRGPFHVEPISVFVRTAIAEYFAISKLPPETAVSNIKVDWE